MKRFGLGEMAIVLTADPHALRYIGEICVIKKIDPPCDLLMTFFLDDLPEYRVQMLCDGSIWLAYDNALKKIPPREEPASMRHEQESEVSV